MPTCSLTARETERMLQLLEAYDRDELWLRTRYCYRLGEQPGQVAFDVVDAAGTALADGAGRQRPHTLQAYSPAANVVPGQLVHLYREGGQVHVHVLPVAARAPVKERYQGALNVNAASPPMS